MIFALSFTQLSAMHSLKKAALFLLLIIPLSATLFCKKDNNNAESPDAAELKDSVIASNLSYPWEILWGPDDHIWMTERGGKISRLNPATGTVTPVITIAEVVSNGEGGLLGMALHPDFSASPHVFVVYNYNSSGYKEKVVRYTYNGTTLTNPVTIIENIAASSIHNGSRLLIVNDKLLITTGDANNQPLAQNEASPNGKILRLNLDGSIPADNPVAGNPYWSMGHRNPQGLVFANNILYSSEHGPTTDDEINIIEKGRNYGWPAVHGFCNEPGEQSACLSDNVAQPVTAWTPTIATCGLDYYNHDEIPQWENSLLMATLKNQRLYQLKLGNDLTSINNTNEYFSNKYGRLRDICISPGGKVYICTSNGGNDKVIEISRK